MLDPLYFKDPVLSENALTVLEKRYLAKNEKGEVIETPKEMFLRVASNVAMVSVQKKEFVSDKNNSIAMKAQFLDEKKLEFYDLMVSGKFLPNSPTLMNAGRPLGQLAACFVLPIEDSIPSIFDAVKHAAMVHKSGGGTGFSFSRLRPKDSRVAATGGLASGPLSFLRVFNSATEQIKQGGTRRGANMAILRVDHPDIIDFIKAKEVEGEFNNFNFSVGVTKAFMEAVAGNETYELVDPRPGVGVVGTLDAREVWGLIAQKAWEKGEPGVVFLDAINEDNPVPFEGEIEATNPCGEQPLLPYEACNLGSINLSKFYAEKEHEFDDWPVEWNELEKTVYSAVEFLDNVIDISKYPLPDIEKMVRYNRKIGLGVMGWADLLFKARIPYNSPEARRFARDIMGFIDRKANEASINLASERGVFPAAGEYPHSYNGPKRRNATVTTIAPTGTLSIIADCSSGIEPLFALYFVKHILDGKKMVTVNEIFRQALKDELELLDEDIEDFLKGGSIQNDPNIPDSLKKVFVTAMDISPNDHVLMQAAFQENTDNAVSKTVNLPNEATVEDIKEVFRLAYDSGCKGVTVYRDGSRQEQVLNLAKKKEEEEKPASVKKLKEYCAEEDNWKLMREVAERPYKLTGFTQKIKTGLGTLYLTVNELEGRPFEVFATIAKSGRSATAKAEAIGRLVSLALRSGIGVARVVRQLKGIGGEHPVFGSESLVLSIPDAIAKVLEDNYITDRKETTDQNAWSNKCPDCGGPLVLQEGCQHCKKCGYSRCS